MSNIKCIIVEDEPLGIKILSDYISKTPFLELQGSFKDALLATDWLRSNKTDLIFLDIHLPKLKGMDFLKTLSIHPAIIVTTAYQQYAVEGFNLNVTDYLLKPFEFERFLVAVNKVKLLSDENTGNLRVEKDFIFVNSERKRVKISFSDIIYIESQREYVKIVTLKKEYVSKISTHEIEQVLPAHLFKRIHRSFIISVDKIESYSNDMVDVGGVAIPIGRGYKDIIVNL